VTLSVRLGTPDDIGAILALVSQAAMWLGQDIGTDQWAKPWPSRAERDDRVRRGLEGGRTWIVDEDDEKDDEAYLPVASITCRAEANPKLWNEWEQQESSVYVSRLIVNRNYSHRKIGQELLDLAGKWAREQYGARWIRIDVWTTNVALHGYYEKDGFGFIRFNDDVEYPSAALFQRSTDDLRWAGAPRLTKPPRIVEPFQQFEFSRQASADAREPAADLGRERCELARRRRVVRSRPGQRNRRGWCRKRLINRCAIASRSLSRCCQRLLAPGRRDLHRRQLLGRAQPLVVTATPSAAGEPGAISCPSDAGPILAAR
jgi:ribosomal protein S18 acetylase RimI-like enzyme